MAKVFFKSFYKCKEKLQDIRYIKDIFYTEVFFIWYLGNQLKVAGSFSKSVWCYLIHPSTR